MFDLNDDMHTRVTKDNTPMDRLVQSLASGQPEGEHIGHRLDGEDMREKHKQLIGCYRQELERQGENRFQQSVEEDYYDNIQWTEEEAQELRDRGQAPLAYNVISNSVNWVLGSEKRNRTDFRVLPRRKEESKAAEGKTSLMKYLSDVNRSRFHASRAFKDAIVVGIGWLEAAVQDEDDGEPIYRRYESWRNMLWDSASTELDMSDARYLFRTKWFDVDVACAFFPERAEQIKMAAVDGERFGGFDDGDGDEPMDQAEFDREDHALSRVIVSNKRQRVRLIECWYTNPERVERIRAGTYKGQIFDPTDPRHVESVQQMPESLGEKMMMRMRCAIMTTQDLLYEGPSPYRHNKFPLIPVWGYKRGRDGLPYGMIRGLRDIQDDINKRASKALAILSSNKVVMDEGAVEDMDTFADEIARPDAIIVKRSGKQLEINVDRDLAPAHLELMSRNIQMIQQVGGVTDELRGQNKQGLSGVAIQAVQEQGSIATMTFFDNYRLALQIIGEIELSLIEQFMTDEKQFRIVNARGTAEFVKVNDGLPENDIARTKADFVISEQEYRASLRQAASEQFANMLMKMPPQVALVLLDLWADMLDVANKDEIVKRIRQISGQRDPDATEPTPEEIQAQQAKAAEAQAQQAMFAAELADKQAGAEQKAAQALKTKAEAERVARQTISDNVTTIGTAMEAAAAIATAPVIVPIADSILAESGWPEANVQQPQQQPMTPPAQPMAQPHPAQAGIAPNGMMPDGSQPQQ